MSKRRNRRHRKPAQSSPNKEQDLPLEARQDQPGSSGAWSQEMSDHDTEELPRGDRRSDSGDRGGGCPSFSASPKRIREPLVTRITKAESAMRLGSVRKARRRPSPVNCEE